MLSFFPAEKRRIIFKSFIESQLKYCPLTWMFYSQKSNNKINKLHERTLRIVNNDYESNMHMRNFFLIIIPFFYFHDQNMDWWATEIYKVANVMIYQWEISNNCLILKINFILHIPLALVNTELKGKNLIRFFGVVSWNAIPINIKY